MKHYTFTGAFITVAVAMLITAPFAHALSCLPVDMYLKDVVGKEEVVIFKGKVKDQIETKNYTAEVITVTEVTQGYVESEVFVYHEKNSDWGYMCNAGPAKEGDESVYITIRDVAQKYMVTQRLALTDPLVKTLEADLEEKEVEGQISETTKTDRMNQLMTAISDLFAHIQILFKEYMYLKASK